MSATPIPQERRKQIVKVIFISLLLDLVSMAAIHQIIPVSHAHSFLSRSPSHLSCHFFLNSSNFIAIKSRNKILRTQSLTAFFSDSMHTNNPSPALSAIAMISFSSVAPWALCSPSSRQLPPHSSDPSLTSMDAVELSYGLWLAISLQ